MRPMSASELQEIALDIATEVNRLNLCRKFSPKTP